VPICPCSLLCDPITHHASFFVASHIVPQSTAYFFNLLLSNNLWTASLSQGSFTHYRFCPLEALCELWTEGCGVSCPCTYMHSTSEFCFGSDTLCLMRDLIILLRSWLNVCHPCLFRRSWEMWVVWGIIGIRQRVQPPSLVFLGLEKVSWAPVHLQRNRSLP
jgi:hypothetical protein